MAEPVSWEFIGWYGPYGHNGMYHRSGKYRTVISEIDGIEFNSREELEAWIRDYYDWDGKEVYGNNKKRHSDDG